MRLSYPLLAAIVCAAAPFAAARTLVIRLTCKTGLSRKCTYSRNVSNNGST